MAEEILRLQPDQVKKLVKQGKIEIVSAAPVVDRKPERVSSLEISQLLFGQDFFGPSEVEQTFGVKIAPENLPQIPFPQEDLEVAKSLDQKLVLRVNRAPDGNPLTMEKMGQLLQPKFKAGGKGKVFYDTTWYKDEEFFTKQAPTPRWALTGKSVLPNTLSKNYFEQTQELANYASALFFRGIPLDYQEALNEFAQKDADLSRLVSTDPQKAAQGLARLKLNHMLRPSAADALYDLLITFDAKGERELASAYTWTNTRTSNGNLVMVGYFDSDGVYVSGYWPDYSPSGVGVCPSR